MGDWFKFSMQLTCGVVEEGNGTIPSMVQMQPGEADERKNNDTNPRDGLGEGAEWAK